MATIPLLQTGATAGQIIDTINALIAAHNEGQNPVSVSYEDLTHKPTLNGVEISGDMTTQSARIKITETEDYTVFEETNATKEYADEAKDDAIAAARESVQADLDNKLDKDLGNIERVDSFNGDAMIPIVTGGGIRKTSLVNVASYTKIQNETAMSALDTALAKERKTLTLEGEKDGSNKVFTVKEGYKPGTGLLYYNGILQTPDKDYEETDSRTITLIFSAPEEEDDIMFRAVPA